MDAADLMAQAGNTMGLFSKYVKHPLTSKFNPLSESWRKTGENMSNYMESHLRLHGFKRLIEKGVHPKVAGPRVQELLVDYTVQSGFDQGLRDIFPFIRFRLGSIAWTKAVLTKPRKLMLPAVTQRAADEWGTPRDITKPPTAWDRLDIATPKFSLPTRAGAEVSLGTLGAFGRHPSARRGLLGELHPLLKLGLEQTLDREIWSNKRFASDTRAKGVEKLFAKEGLSRWGAKRDEIDGVLKKLLASTPVSRQLGSVRKLMEGFEEGPVGGLVGGLKWTLAIREKRNDALQDLKNNLRLLINEKIQSGEVYSFEKPLSAKGLEDTMPEVKLLLDRYTATLKAIRERGKLEAASRGQ